MPIQLPPTRRPSSAADDDAQFLVPIYRDACTGRRHIQLDFRLGPDFAADDVTVHVTGATLSVVAAYSAEIGAYGTQVRGNSRLSPSRSTAIIGVTRHQTGRFVRHSDRNTTTYT